MSKTIEGTFRGGKVEFAQTPAAPEGTRVLVTFLPQAVPDRSNDTSGHIKYGMFKGPIATNEEDFAIAEWHGDKEDAGG